MPVSILSSHFGTVPLSVAKSMSKPAVLNSAYGIAVSEIIGVNEIIEGFVR